jgi:YidC/Oxa1 family membrane protein insertase
MFTTIIVQPIFNLLVLIYALIPGHNFGVAIILFTVLIRLLMWPLVKKQLHHAKALRELQPELKKIKAATKGDRQKESKMTMELYKERQINPFGSLALVLVQAPILIGLYVGLQKIIKDPQAIVDFSYPALHNLSWLQTLAHDISQFDPHFLGIDLSRPASGPMGLYLPALFLVAASAVTQYIQSKQIMPKSQDSRGLRAILRDAGKGKSADQSEVNAAVGRSTLIFIPAVIFIIGLHFAAALPLYWLTSALVAIFQQSRVLKEDVKEAEAVADEPASSDEPAKRGAGKKKKPSRKKRSRK